MTQLFSRRLSDRNRASGAQPLITYYDESSQSRTELSGSSFANWVDKTAGLLTDELLIEAGQPVRLDLARTAPAHWVTLVWVAAIWRVGCPVLVSPNSDTDAVVEVVGPEGPLDEPAADRTRVACSLHPLGLGFPDALPTGVLDYGVEVRAQPDSFGGPYPDAAATAWIEDRHRLTQAEVITSSPTDPNAAGRRTMIIPDPQEPVWATVQRALVDPVVTGGSAVIVIGGDAERRADIARSEQVQD